MLFLNESITSCAKDKGARYSFESCIKWLLVEKDSDITVISFETILNLTN